MQPPVKFRVWDNTNKIFVDEVDFCIYRGNPVEVYTTVGDGWCSKEMATTDAGTGEYVEENWVIQQFTTFQDKNGKDIYEGDIVEAYMNDQDKNKKGKVIFERGRFNIVFHYMPLDEERSKLFTYTVSELHTLVEVVGNIFQESK